jgi:D-alanyl-D-alanine carboxypeptidase/D-alanyl-D-alanine-endopeptidase (penicillin-binding protein 4)
MKKIYILFLLISFSSCKAQKTITHQQAIQNFKNTKELQSAHIGISIRELNTGKEIISVNSNHSFAPASNLKLLYTLTAIDKFGKNYRFITNLYQTGKVKNNILNGNLIFQPCGDPSFASIRFKEDYNKIIDEIINSISQKNIQNINGYLIMELKEWRYPAPGSIPVEDLGNYYGTGAWEFNFNDNRIDIYLNRSNQVGKPVSINHCVPELPDYNPISKVVTAKTDTDDESYIYTSLYSNSRYILGTIPAGKKSFRVKGGMPNPPLSFLKLLQKELANNNIDVKGIKIEYAQKQHNNLIWKYTSKSLLDIVKITNDYSMNHFSEALAWLLVKKKSEYGYLDKKAIHNFFVPYGFENADIEDGCGLAPDNLIQPAQMTYFLKLMTEKLGQKTVLDILPHGGEDGYAKYFLKDYKTQKQVWVKSGSVSKVRNYSGIFKAKSGKYYSFSIMTNFFIGKHKPVRIAIEKITHNFINQL